MLAVEYPKSMNSTWLQNQYKSIHASCIFITYQPDHVDAFINLFRVTH